MSPDIVEILILDTSTLLPTVCEAKLAEVNTMEVSHPDSISKLKLTGPP
jgi:hypothetical protein